MRSASVGSRNRGIEMWNVKLPIAAAGAAVTLFVFVGVASGNRLSVSSSTMRATWTSAELSGGFGTVSCAFTLEGSMHTRTTTKTAGALVGYVTRASVGPCRTGSATVLTATLPWHVRYSSFAGTLPNIVSITENITDSAWQIKEPVFGVTCLFAASETEPNTVSLSREAGGALTSARLGGTIESNCGLRGTAGGTSGTPTVLGSTTRITVTLI